MNDSTEIEIIMNALRSPSYTTYHTPKKVLQEIEPSILNTLMPNQKDAVEDIAKIKARQAKRRARPVGKWTFSDFLRHLDQQLGLYGCLYERTNLSNDRIQMGKLYDVFAAELDIHMSNQVLKEYLEWWAGIWGPKLHDTKIFVSMLMAKEWVSKFLNRFENLSTETTNVLPSTTTTTDKTDINTLYELGGLPLVMMSKGIVVGYRILREKQIAGAFGKISDALRTFSKEVLTNTMRVTIAGAPYPSADTVDFMSLARRCLDTHGIKEFNGVNYQSFFGG